MRDRNGFARHRSEEEAGVGYIAPLASATQLQLTTFGRDGMPAAAPVLAVVDGDRAYFAAGSGSGSVQSLRRIDAARVTRCSMRGLVIYGPALDAAARRLPAEQASQVTGNPALRRPIRHRFVIPLLRRTRRERLVHYELLADGAMAGGDE